MYQPEPVATSATSASATAVAHLAMARQLAVIAGAGLSRAEPTDLPSGATLAKRTYTELAPLLGIELADDDQWNLLTVADAVARNQGGRQALREAMPRYADFLIASPNYAHKVLAMLALEGAVTLLETNWDTCIERAAAPESLVATVTNEDRHDLGVASVFKLHGCATKTSSLLITTDDLEQPPLWSSTEVASALGTKTVVFVGIGDVAEYTKKSVTALRRLVPNAEIHIVDPAVDKDGWEAGEWKNLVGDVDESFRHATEAESFLDGVLRAYVRLTLGVADGIARGDEQASAVTSGYDQLQEALYRENPVEVVQWLRSACLKLKPGDTALAHQELQYGTISLATVLGSCSATGDMTLDTNGVVRTAEGTFCLMVAVEGMNGRTMATEAMWRLTSWRQSGQLGNDEEPVVVCLGHIGPLGSNEVSLSSLSAGTIEVMNVAEDVFAEPIADDVLLGPLHAPHRLIDGHSAMQQVAQ